MVKRKKRKWGRIIIILLLIISLSLIIITNINNNLSSNIIKNNNDMTKYDNDNKEKEYKLSLVMVGDALIHDDIYLDAKENNSYNFDKMLDPLKEILSTYDLGYYNQETILGGTELGLSSYPAFNSPYEVGDAFVNAGFNLVSLATNHTLDRGRAAVINSRNYWNNQENVLAVGSYTSEEERNEIKIMEKNNITYTMLNYTYGTNGIPVPNGEDYLVNVWPVTETNPTNDKSYQNYKEQVKKDIEAVRSSVDVLIVAMHWGVEYQTTPNDYQKDIAAFLASLDVDIIIGTHPHVIQPIEWIDDTLVIYSLGNFISAHEVVNMDNRIGLMSSIDITKTIDKDENTTISLNNLNNELLYTYYAKDYQDFKVIPFSNLTEEYLNDYKNISTKYINIIKSIDNNIKVKVP